MNTSVVEFNGRNTATGAEKRRASAFTMIEMLIVVSIVGMLLAGVFKLISLAGEHTKRATTVTRIQRLEYALAEYKSIYGHYPPVAQYTNPDPYKGDQGDSDGKSLVDMQFSEWPSVGKLYSGNALRAARAQPVAFWFPTPQILDDYIAILYKEKGWLSANQMIGGTKTNTKPEWYETRVFKFGVLSYLLPRLEVMGGLGQILADGEHGPKKNFFYWEQWKKNNNGAYPGKTGSMEDLQKEEKMVAGRILHFLEKTLSGWSNSRSGNGFLMGEQMRPADEDDHRFSLVHAEGDKRYVLGHITIQDGWGNDLFYYSAPPYSSYKVWSAGPNGKTFPASVNLKSLAHSDHKDDLPNIMEWIKDDIVGGVQ